MLWAASSDAFAPMSSTMSKNSLSTPFHADNTIRYAATVDQEETKEKTSINVATTIEVESKDEVPMEKLNDLLQEMESEAEKAVAEIMDDQCEVDPATGKASDEELCVEGEARTRFREKFKTVIGQTLRLVRGVESAEDEAIISKGEELEKGWEKRANSSALVRNAEVWKFALKSVFAALKPRKLKAKGASEEEVKAAQVKAAEFIRDGLLVLDPSFVKLGQVASTRTDVLPETYTEVLKTLTDNVPGFGGKRAKEIVSQELGRPCDEVFTDFSPEPLKAASLGQVHTAYYKGKKVAIKVQRAGLKELFDIDLKNLKKLAVLLDKFDPKSDGADRDWYVVATSSGVSLDLLAA